MKIFVDDPTALINYLYNNQGRKNVLLVVGGNYRSEIGKTQTNIMLL